MMQQKGLVWLPALSSVSFAALAGTKSSKNLPVTEVSSSHNECKHRANLLSKKMPSYTVTLETRNLNRQKKRLEIAGYKHGVNSGVELKA